MARLLQEAEHESLIAKAKKLDLLFESINTAHETGTRNFIGEYKGVNMFVIREDCEVADISENTRSYFESRISNAQTAHKAEVEANKRLRERIRELEANEEKVKRLIENAETFAEERIRSFGTKVTES